MSCDGRVDFPLEERMRLVDMSVYDLVNFLFKVNNLKPNLNLAVDCSIIEWLFVFMQQQSGVNANLELVDKFCYLGDMLSVDGDAGAAVETRI